VVKGRWKVDSWFACHGGILASNCIDPSLTPNDSSTWCTCNLNLPVTPNDFAFEVTYLQLCIFYLLDCIYRIY
jgi:hypothetical protein